MKISISYKSYEIDEDNKRKQKEEYGNDLLKQINEKHSIYKLTY